ncbi:hypothetical protein [Botrimarina hoheduenensis]|uniref:Uncharacterized protein n=1 Tax=Botrimarina hoheduenensis TaxID=2528000 RepID=A0A5C5WEX2_9BACT|nr:hypothetical protein [Botrimarina hoheduenensis]TWT48653.1 hypothetical protein Pla111_04280 [Botrimarina hoheduenensis]
MYELIRTALEVQFPFNMIIVLGTLGIALAAIGIVGAEVRKFATHRIDFELKREMVAQGLSAEEIDRLLQAGSDSRHKQ